MTKKPGEFSNRTHQNLLGVELKGKDDQSYFSLKRTAHFNRRGDNLILAEMNECLPRANISCANLKTMPCEVGSISQEGVFVGARGIEGAEQSSATSTVSDF